MKYSILSLSLFLASCSAQTSINTRFEQARYCKEIAEFLKAKEHDFRRNNWESYDCKLYFKGNKRMLIFEKELRTMARLIKIREWANKK